MGRGGRRLDAFGDGTRGKAPERAQAVIHDDGAGRGDIERESRRNPHEMLAARRQFGGQHPALGTEHIGRALGMGEAREIVGLVKDFDPDQAASFG